MGPLGPGPVRQFEVLAWLNWERLSCTRPPSRNGFEVWPGIGKRKPLIFLRSPRAICYGHAGTVRSRPRAGIASQHEYGGTADIPHNFSAKDAVSAASIRDIGCARWNKCDPVT